MDPKTFKNESIECTLTTSEGCEIKLEVTALPSYCAELYEEATKKIRRQVSLPGFRKGKAPTDMVQKKFASYIEGEWRELLVRETFVKALELSHTRPWKQENAATPKLESASLEEGAKLSYNFESEPAIPEIKKDDLTFPPRHTPDVVDDTIIDKQIEDLRKIWASFEEQADAVAELGDTCKIKLEVLRESGPTTVVDNQDIQLEQGEAADWIRDLVLGCKAGDAKEKDLAEDAPNPEEFKGKDTRFKVTVLSVKKRKPADDETLLQKTKQESMDALRKTISEAREKEFKQQAEQKDRDAFWELLRQQYPFELPKTLLAEEKQRTMRQRIQQLREQRVPDEQILKKEQELEVEVHKQVSDDLHTLFASLRLADELKARPTEREVIAGVEGALNVLRMFGQAQAHNDPQYLQNVRQKVYLDLVKEKVENHFLDLKPEA